jgi:branched-chain amino acid transport system ATP-binding protein
MLKVEHLDAHYEDLQVLWDLSLEVNQGELVALIGSNGSGKSTLLRVITGLLPTTHGRLTYKGTLLNHLTPHEIVNLGISMVPEGRRVFPKMTVLANLEMGAFPNKAREDKPKSLKRVYEIFPILRERAQQFAGSLSGGEQQMLVIGRALMSKNDFFLLDEMSLGLAPIIVQNIFEVVMEINKTGVSILLVEQNVPATLRIADRAYVLESGRIVKHDEAKMLLNDPFVKESYLGIEQMAQH